MILRETFFVCICYYKKFIVFFEITTTRRLLLLIFRLGNQKTDTARSRNTKFLTSRRTIAITSGRFSGCLITVENDISSTIRYAWSRNHRCVGHLPSLVRPIIRPWPGLRKINAFNYFSPACSRKPKIPSANTSNTNQPPTGCSPSLYPSLRLSLSLARV